MKLTICGNLCDICRAYRGNYKKNDERVALSAAWKKYLGLDLPPDKIHCEGDGCCSDGLGLGHEDCRYKPCASRHGLAHCGECPDFPCAQFDDTRQMSEKDMRRKLGRAFDLAEYKKFIMVFDNRTWVSAFRRKSLSKGLAMCGSRCDLCTAFAPNIRKRDRRRDLGRMWKKYYDLDIPPEKIVCDGCRAIKTGARRVDAACPVRACVIKKEINHCGDCDAYPCPTFGLRRGLSVEQAREKLGAAFDAEEYRDFLLAYDNSTRLGEYKKIK